MWSWGWTTAAGRRTFTGAADRVGRQSDDRQVLIHAIADLADLPQGLHAVKAGHHMVQEDDEALTQAGVNVELGLDYCGGEEDFYREMLRMFCAQGQEKQAGINGYSGRFCP